MTQDPSSPLAASPIFLVGAARSGTTLLQSMIDAHPDVSILGEVHFFDQILQLRRDIPEPIDAAKLGELRDGVLKCHAIQFIPEFERVLDRALDHLKATRERSYGTFFRLLLTAFGEIQGSSRVGEKTPNNIRYLPEIIELFPDARIVHILRDPRDSISSRVRYPFSSPSIIFNSLMWKIEMIYAVDFKRALGETDRSYAELRYEDLVANPEKELRRLCAFLDLDYAPSMLDGHQRADSVFQNEPWKDGVTRPVNVASVSSWETRLTPAQAALIEAIAGNYLSYGSYESRANVGTIGLGIEALRDVARYVPYKIRERFEARRQLQARTTIGSDSSKLNVMVRRAIADAGPATPGA